MTKIFKSKVLWSLFFIPAGTLFFPQSRAQNANTHFLTGTQAATFWDFLAGAPYAQSGNHGLIVYMISYSGCGNCIAFLRDFWDSRRGGITLREIFVPVNQQRYLNEAADIAITRDAASAEAYYKQIRVAPPAHGSAERQAALQRMVNFTTQWNGMLRQIGHIQDGFPTFILRVPDSSNGLTKVLVISGWGDPRLKQDLDQWIREASK